VKQRLLASVIVDEATGCWNWTKAKDPRPGKGHGLMTVGGKMLKPHRLAYELFVGPIPAGMHILHSCDNGACCNPAHLRPGTHQDNMRDRDVRGRAAKGLNNHFGRVKYQGADNVSSRLTVEAVREIRSSAESNTALAKKFGVTRDHVRDVRARRKSWLHVD
jgi:hypothetical protein